MFLQQIFSRTVDNWQTCRFDSIQIMQPAEHSFYAEYFYYYISYRLATTPHFFFHFSMPDFSNFNSLYDTPFSFQLFMLSHSFFQLYCCMPHSFFLFRLSTSHSFFWFSLPRNTLLVFFFLLLYTKKIHSFSRPFSTPKSALFFLILWIYYYKNKLPLLKLVCPFFLLTSNKICPFYNICSIILFLWEMNIFKTFLCHFYVELDYLLIVLIQDWREIWRRLFIFLREYANKPITVCVVLMHIVLMLLIKEPCHLILRIVSTLSIEIFAGKFTQQHVYVLCWL